MGNTESLCRTNPCTNDDRRNAGGGKKMSSMSKEEQTVTMDDRTTQIKDNLNVNNNEDNNIVQSNQG